MTKDGRVRKFKNSRREVTKSDFFPIPGEGMKEQAAKRKALYDAGMRDGPPDAGDKSDLNKWRTAEFERLQKSSSTFEAMHDAAQKAKVEKTKGAKKNIK